MSYESHASTVINEQTVAGSTCPAFDLSESTLVDSLDFQQAYDDAISSLEAEETALDGFQVHRQLSPSVYFEDLDFKGWLSEQLRVIGSNDEYLRLIEAAEEEGEDVIPKMENRAMSPSEHFEASNHSPSSASEEAQVSRCFPKRLTEWLTKESHPYALYVRPRILIFPRLEYY